MLLKTKVKSIGALQEGDKKDGSGKWYARDLVLAVEDGSMYPDEFIVRLTNDHAKECKLVKDALCTVDISFSVRDYQGRQYQDSWVRRLTPTLSHKEREEGEQPF